MSISGIRPIDKKKYYWIYFFASHDTIDRIKKSCQNDSSTGFETNTHNLHNFQVSRSAISLFVTNYYIHSCNPSMKFTNLTKAFTNWKYFW